MFFILIERVVKYGTGATQKFAARTANRTHKTYAGPFAKRGTAERAALRALGTHTCLHAQVMSLEELRAWKETADYAHRPDHYELDLIRAILARHGHATEVSS